MGLQTYQKKRDFGRTSEPRGKRATPKRRGARLSFVVQKHRARALHYDFRLELDGVLLSWAVPKGPSLEPGVKRLAMQTEDHPLEYGAFEGTIPKGEYGAGKVEIWDKGTWQPEGDPHRALERGRLSFVLDGEKLHGGFHLVRSRLRDASRKQAQSWLLIKRHDDDNSQHTRTSRPQKTRGKRTPLPDFVEPQLATLVDRAPPGQEWLSELKLDGYRMLARCDGDDVRLLTRRGHDWTERMPSVAAELARLRLDRAFIDGEVVVLRDGVSSFQRLQNAISAGRDGECVYYAFDLLFLEGRDLRDSPLHARKELLQDTLIRHKAKASKVRFSEHVRGQAPELFDKACERGLEGIVCKRADAPYSGRRDRSWLKVKCIARQELVIGGYTDPKGGRAGFGALLVGSHEAGSDKLTYAGRVGTGFTARSIAELTKKLKPLARAQSPFTKPLRGADARGVHWVAPKLVAEVAFAERTDQGLVRHASFQGLREDKPAAEVTAEVAQPVAGEPRADAPLPALRNVRLTHPDRVLFPEQGITKAELALYYAQVAEPMLAHLADRPLMLVRCPQGEGSACFHQKHPSKGLSKAVQRIAITDKSGEKLEHMAVRDAEGLIALVQIGALEIHAWGCRSGNIEHPDQLTFDLDPDEDLPWRAVVEAARTVRAKLESLDLECFLKTTGGKGLHIVVPIKPVTPWDEAKAFSKALAEAVARAEPDKYLTTITKAKRKGKTLIDYLRNGRGATAVCAYSTRARAHAPVATPIRWEELTAKLDAGRFTLSTVPERIKRQPDPWAGFGAHRPAITSSALKKARAK